MSIEIAAVVILLLARIALPAALLFTIGSLVSRRLPSTSARS